MSDHNKANRRTCFRLGDWRLGTGRTEKKKKKHIHIGHGHHHHHHRQSVPENLSRPKKPAVPARPTGSTDSLSLWGIAPYDDIAVSLSCHRRPSFRSFSFFSRPHRQSVFLVWLVWLLSRPGVDTIAGYFPSQGSVSSNQSHGRPLEAWKKFRMLLRRF